MRRLHVDKLVDEHLSKRPQMTIDELATLRAVPYPTNKDGERVAVQSTKGKAWTKKNSA